MVNKVILIGRLAADPEVKAGATGNLVVTMRLVTNAYGGRDEDGTRKEYAEFHQLVTFGKQAQVAADYLRKGKLVFVEGRVQTRSWEDAEKGKRYMTEIVIENLQMLSPKSPAEAAA